MSNYYHPRLRNHENFSYANSKNVQQSTPGFNAQAQAEKKQSLEDIWGPSGTTRNYDWLSTEKENFPTDLEVNSKEQCKAIYMRSGKKIEGDVTEEERTLPRVDNNIKCEPVININIPFVDALEKIPNYFKFVKEVLSKKRKFEDYETVKLKEVCSAILHKNLPQKLKDLGSFTIPRKIGGSSFDKTLCDLGDVLVKVNKFVFPANFVVLDMEEDHEIPFIIGRPFLAIGGTLIDVQACHLTLRGNEENVRFDIYNGANCPVTMNTFKRIESFSPLESEDKKMGDVCRSFTAW
ncbi:uncharacterized protein LOC133806475 [Humulus lupulus]|uniref:uncharacterized protein LOC133806475 n=1 Tax=Humulus lupulus TaxID=3486 RepID=UPI002B40D6E4|nr:uncharacterized protein LOC133806475 [Humulus lupulus]